MTLAPHFWRPTLALVDSLLYKAGTGLDRRPSDVLLVQLEKGMCADCIAGCQECIFGEALAQLTAIEQYSLVATGNFVHLVSRTACKMSPLLWLGFLRD